MDELPIIKLSYDDYDRMSCRECHGIYVTEMGIFYWVNGKNHRLDGPAMVWEDGCELWIINDKEFSSQEEMESSIEYYLCINGLENYG